MYGAEVRVFQVHQHLPGQNLGVFVDLFHVVDRPRHNARFLQHLEPVGSGVGGESLFKQRGKFILTCLAVAGHQETRVFDQDLKADGTA